MFDSGSKNRPRLIPKLLPKRFKRVLEGALNDDRVSKNQKRGGEVHRGNIQGTTSRFQVRGFGAVGRETGGGAFSPHTHARQPLDKPMGRRTFCIVYHPSVFWMLSISLLPSECFRILQLMPFLRIVQRLSSYSPTHVTELCNGYCFSILQRFRHV